jgi:D-amino-acid dehydrogenase
VLAAAEGVDFRFGVEVRALAVEGGRIGGIVTDRGTVQGDAYVLALGPRSPLLLRPVGIRIPVYPVKGYSITTPIADPDGAPESTIMDETFKVAITRLGDRVRAAGSAELKGYDSRLREPRRQAILHSVRTLFPRASTLREVSFWTGLRPMTPDGPPLLGPTRYPNLYLNTGHGTLGWTMACGSGRVLTDLLSGREPEVSLDGLTLERYGRLLA